MDWVESLNHAITYIDKNLDGTIDYGEISRITASPISMFQRFFALTTGVTLAEYIRRRKLTCALNDLRKTDKKVIDIAIKYGYESSDAFRVAFVRLYGITPSEARRTAKKLHRYDRIFLTLTISYVKGESDMVLLNIDKYRYNEPLFEGARIILNSLGENYTPEYIQGVSGAAFKIAGGCPSRPTCVWDRWTPDFIRYMGYEVTEYPYFDENENDVSNGMIAAVKKQIDNGKPALVWNAFSLMEYNVVCGYDDEAKHFIGRGALHGNNGDYAREPWDKAKTAEISFGAIIIGDKVADFSSREAEIASLVSAVNHARNDAPVKNPWEVEGIKFYYQWADEYSKEGKERGVADAYCYDVYSSVRKAAGVYLHSLADKYDGASDLFHYAAACFERESDELEKARPYLSWASTWGIDEERSKTLAPILKAAVKHYENGIEYLEKILQLLDVKI